ncbi:MAG TPA: PhnD/SsuA/transferrin family substrate-binding protein [Tissierellaceae bacterium]|nr:PhnD/SsuA/transferrin family substrate-binding protein [Tissierellaceae bacterium]
MLKKGKGILLLVLSLSLSLLLFVGCSNDNGGTGNGDEEGNKKIDKLVVGFVPSREPDEIVTATEPLKDMLTDQLGEFGYDVDEVEITVGTNYEAVGEGLSAGTIDVALIPGGTYVLYDDSAEVILAATRDSLSNDSDDPKEWNENKPTEGLSEQTTSYRAIMIAGPSDKGKELAAKVNDGEELTWEDLNSATWSVMSSSSPAGYIYPALWLDENYDKTITDLDNAIISDSYGSAFARLAADQVDIVLAYADARRDFEEKWIDEYGQTDSVWEDTDLIGVTPAIYNDTVSVSTTSDKMDDELKEAIQESFINIGDTEEGKEVIEIYSHNGYQKVKDSDYDNERKAQELIKDLE